ENKEKDNTHMWHGNGISEENGNHGDFYSSTQQVHTCTDHFRHTHTTTHTQSTRDTHTHTHTHTHTETHTHTHTHTHKHTHTHTHTHTNESQHMTAHRHTLQLDSHGLVCVARRQCAGSS